MSFGSGEKKMDEEQIKKETFKAVNLAVKEIWESYNKENEADFCHYMAERWGMENT